MNIKFTNQQIRLIKELLSSSVMDSLGYGSAEIATARQVLCAIEDAEYEHEQNIEPENSWPRRSRAI